MMPPFDIIQLPGLTPYLAGWELQREIHGQVATGERPPTILLLEHESTYTTGRRTEPSEFPTDGTQVIEVDRGGKITWHGPGQLVAYPIIPLRQPLDVIAYLRRLEDAVIAVCLQVGVRAGRVPKRSGVWAAPDRKVCAVGIHVAQDVTMHGLALNCDPDLTAFDRIVPCGIADASVTSLSIETDTDVTVAQLRPLLAAALVAELTSQLPGGQRPN